MCGGGLDPATSTPVCCVWCVVWCVWCVVCCVLCVVCCVLWWWWWWWWWGRAASHAPTRASQRLPTPRPPEVFHVQGLGFFFFQSNPPGRGICAPHPASTSCRTSRALGRQGSARQRSGSATKYTAKVGCQPTYCEGLVSSKEKNVAVRRVRFTLYDRREMTFFWGRRGPRDKPEKGLCRKRGLTLRNHSIRAVFCPTNFTTFFFSFLAGPGMPRSAPGCPGAPGMPSEAQGCRIGQREHGTTRHTAEQALHQTLNRG